jgi:hypothetical protein
MINVLSSMVVEVALFIRPSFMNIFHRNPSKQSGLHLLHYPIPNDWPRQIRD